MPANSVTEAAAEPHTTGQNMLGCSSAQTAENYSRQPQSATLHIVQAGSVTNDCTEASPVLMSSHMNMECLQHVRRVAERPADNPSRLNK